MKAISNLMNLLPFKKRSAHDSMERSVSRRHATIMWLLYGALFIAIMGALAYIGSTYQTKTLPSGKLSLTTPYTNYLATDEITFTITNNFNSTIVFKNNCPQEPLVVYRWDGNAWKRIHAMADPLTCVGKKSTIEVPSGASVTGTFKSVQSLFSQPGYYRIVAYVDALNSMAYRDIRIVDTPIPPEIPVAVAPTQNNTSTSRQRSSTGTSGSSAPAPTTPPPSPPALQSISLTHAAGTINLDYSATTLFFKSVTFNAGSGCSSYEKNRSSGTSIEINFKCAGGETQIVVYISGGTVYQNCEGNRC